MSIKSSFKVFAALAAILAVPSVVSAANWHLVYSDQEYKQYIDLESLKRNGDVVKLWDRSVYQKPNNGIKEEKSLMEFNCLKNEFSIINIIQYYEDGRINPLPIDRNWYPVAPETVSEVIFDIVCVSE